MCRRVKSAQPQALIGMSLLVKSVITYYLKVIRTLKTVLWYLVMKWKTVNSDELNVLNETLIELQNNANKICLW